MLFVCFCHGSEILTEKYSGDPPKNGLTGEIDNDKFRYMTSSQEKIGAGKEFRVFVLTSIIPTYVGTAISINLILRNISGETVPILSSFILGLLACFLGPGLVIAYGAAKISFVLFNRINNWTRYILTPLLAFFFSLIIGYVFNVLFS